MGPGRLKQLLPIGGEPAIRRCLMTLAEAGVKEIVAVIKPDDRLAHAVEGLASRIVVNPISGGEMAGSVRLGLGEIDPSSTGVLVLPADHPLVKADTIRELLAEHLKNPEAIVIPVVDGRRGHPTIFPRARIDEIFHGKNLREIRDSFPEQIRYIDVEDIGAVMDIDTPEDYDRACSHAAQLALNS